MGAEALGAVLRQMEQLDKLVIETDCQNSLDHSLFLFPVHPPFFFWIES